MGGTVTEFVVCSICGGGGTLGTGSAITTTGVTGGLTTGSGGRGGSTTTGTVNSGLPKGFKGEYRARVARVVAGGPCVEGVAPETPPERAQATRPVATAANREARPAAPAPSQADDAQAALRDVQKMGAAALVLLLRSKHLIRTIVILLAVVACIYGGAAIFRAVKAHWKQAVATPVAVTQPAPATPVPMSTPAVPVPAPAPPVVVEVQPPSAPPPPIAAPAVVTPAPPPIDTAAVAQQAALEKQRREEQERLAQERENTIEQITNLVAAEIATAGNSRRIAKSLLPPIQTRLPDIPLLTEKY